MCEKIALEPGILQARSSPQSLFKFFIDQLDLAGKMATVTKPLPFFLLGPVDLHSPTSHQAILDIPSISKDLDVFFHLYGHRPSFYGICISCFCMGTRPCCLGSLLPYARLQAQRWFPLGKSCPNHHVQHVAVLSQEISVLPGSPHSTNEDPPDSIDLR